MTKAACELILRISVLCLTWRTIKELKRTTAPATTKIKSKSDNHIGTGEGISIDTDWEILQLWTLYAFHNLYIYSGLEWIASIFPLYYYIKMILLIVTTIPATKFPNFWFEVILVPMMQKMHELLDLDWKGYIQKEAILLPWQILDFFILPGLISDELDEVKFLKRLRYQQFQDAITMGEKNHDDHEKKKDEDDCCEQTSGSSEEEEVKGGAVTVESNHNNTWKQRKFKNSGKPHTDEHSISTRTSSRLKSKPSSKTRTRSYASSRPSTTTPTKNTITAPVARSRMAVSSMHLRKFSSEHRQVPAASPDSTAAEGDSLSYTSRLRSRLRRSRAAAKVPNRPIPEAALPRPKRSDSAAESAQTSRRNAQKSKADHGDHKQDVSDAPPISTIALRKQRIVPSSSTPPRSLPSPRVTTRRRSTRTKAGAREIKSGLISTSTTIENTNVPTDTPKNTNTIIFMDDDFDDDNMSISSRPSVGSSVRKFITGNDNIRIRDFLFDLELPSIPSPKRGSLGDDASLVSARTSRSTRSRSDISKNRLNEGTRSRNGKIEDRRKALEEFKKERDARRARVTSRANLNMGRKSGTEKTGDVLLANRRREATRTKARTRSVVGKTSNARLQPETRTKSRTFGVAPELPVRRSKRITSKNDKL